MPDIEQLDYLEVENPEIFEVLNNPLRFRILRRLIEPSSIRQVAEELGVPPTRLYYHFNLLEEAGVIHVVETRKVGAMLQKVYQTRAKSFRPSPKLTDSDLPPKELARITSGVVLDGAKADALETLTKNFAAIKDDRPADKVPGSLGRTVGFFSEDEARAFAEKLERFIEEEFGDERDRREGSEYGFTFVFFPIAGSIDEAGS